MMAGLVRCKALSDRVAPDGTWSHGDVILLSPEAARERAEQGLVEVLEGADLPPTDPASLRSGIDLGHADDFSVLVAVKP